MQPGWHTYWRYPGDSGVPPRFSFSGSDNLATVKVLYPAPHAFTDEAGTTIGYKGNVIFPLRVVPRDKGKPVTLRAKLDYAVCEKLCVPVEAKLELTLPPNGGADNAALAAAEARVPKPVSAAAGGPDREARQRRQAQAAGLRRPCRAHRGAGRAVRRGTDGGMGAAHPQARAGAPAGHLYFGFELDGLPPGVDPKAPFELTFTIVQGDRATRSRLSRLSCCRRAMLAPT